MTIVSRMSERGCLRKRRDSTAVTHSTVRQAGWCVFASIASLSKAVHDALAPVGYEDETGFHFGQPPVSADIVPAKFDAPGNVRLARVSSTAFFLK